MDLEHELVRALEDALCQISSKYIGNRVKIYWCRRHRAKTCDLIAQILPASHGTPTVNTATWDSDCVRKLICDVVNKSKGWCIPLEKCEVVFTPLLQLHAWLNRTVMAAVVLKHIEEQRKDLLEKRTLSLLPIFQALIYTPTLNVRDTSCSLTDLRSLIIMELIKRLLELNGGSCQIYGGSGFSQKLVNDCKAEVSSRLTQPVKQIGLQNDLKHIEIDLVGTADRLGHIIHLHDRMHITACILVTSEHANVQTAAFKEDWDLTKDENGRPSFMKLIHAPVIWRAVHSSCTDAKQLYRMQINALQNSFLHKYRAIKVGKGDQCSEDLAMMFEHLADLSIKFHILGCSTSKEVRMNVVKSDSGGTFVMYNYARICVLLSKFEVLALLPPIEEVDFSLLKKEEEWHLVVLLAKYPKLINCIISELQDLNSASSISPSFHKIIEFMSELGHQISVYYSHVRVLMSAVHLQDVVFARIWLLKCVKRILDDIFCLLNVTPVKQM